jgi:hypothetical protein
MSGPTDKARELAEQIYGRVIDTLQSKVWPRSEITALIDAALRTARLEAPWFRQLDPVLTKALSNAIINLPQRDMGTTYDEDVRLECRDALVALRRMRAAILDAAPTPTQQVLRGERDWPEDFAHENGNYECICCECGQHFIGHKRRVVCRKCVAEKNAAQASESGQGEADDLVPLDTTIDLILEIMHDQPEPRIHLRKLLAARQPESAHEITQAQAAEWHTQLVEAEARAEKAEADRDRWRETAEEVGRQRNGLLDRAEKAEREARALRERADSYIAEVTGGSALGLYTALFASEERKKEGT